MKSNLWLSVCLGVVCGLSGVGAQDGDGEGEGNGERRRRRDREAEAIPAEAQAAADRLNGEARAQADGQVEVVYTFRSPEQIGDWESRGFDRAESSNNSGGRRRRAANRARAFALGVGGGGGLLQHVQGWTGDWEVEFQLHVERATSRSDLVVGVGEVGIRFGTQLVERRGSGYRPVAGEVVKDAFEGGRQATIRLKREGDVLTAWINGQQVASTDGFRGDMDGPVCFFASDMSVVLHRVRVQGFPLP